MMMSLKKYNKSFLLNLFALFKRLFVAKKSNFWNLLFVFSFFYRFVILKSTSNLSQKCFSMMMHYSKIEIKNNEKLKEKPSWYFIYKLKLSLLFSVFILRQFGTLWKYWLCNAKKKKSFIEIISYHILL